MQNLASDKQTSISYIFKTKKVLAKLSTSFKLKPKRDNVPKTIDKLVTSYPVRVYVVSRKTTDKTGCTRRTYYDILSAGSCKYAVLLES